MRFILVSLVSVFALALAAPAPEPAPQGVAPTCGSDNDCRSFCTAPCTIPYCWPSAFGYVISYIFLRPRLFKLGVSSCGN
ncbi:hypothetical protein CMUS01_09661 [Colletotrichum musicola]|uniref:Uncharacterized protein n=1 Tax=Colletotrichum musicola TaxID=2175873 RepID=A0A8H6K6A8_9PEZI|nr:hypothetical protein CMUS01_09661 [Colletotrichum musicola]